MPVQPPQTLHKLKQIEGSRNASDSFTGLDFESVHAFIYGTYHIMFHGSLQFY